MTRWYEMAGLRLRLDGVLVEAALLEERYGPFAAAPGVPDLHLEVESSPGFFNPVAEKGRPGDSPFIEREGLSTLHRIDYEGVVVAPGHVRAKIDGTLGAVNGLVRHLLVPALLHRGGLLVHASGLCVSGRVWAIAGPSGAGKTTACRHAPPFATVLGDEHLAVLPRGNALWAWGTPIVGELGQPGKPQGGPLQAIHFIEHATQNRLTPLGKREGLRRLIPSTVYYPRGRTWNGLALQACLTVADRVPAFRLEARGDGSFWSLLPAPSMEARL